MPRAKRVSAPLLPKAQVKTGRAKRGIVQPVAQVVKQNTPRRKRFEVISYQLAPITDEVVDALADIMEVMGVA